MTCPFFIHNFPLHRENGHRALGIAEKVIMPIQQNAFPVEFERIDDLPIFITTITKQFYETT